MITIDSRPEPLPKNPDAEPPYLRRRIVAGALATVAALGIGLGASRYFDTDPAANKRAEKLEEESLEHIFKNGGRFYLGDLKLVEGANVRTEPKILNGDPGRNLVESNTVDHPDDLIISAPVVITNEEGTWFGVPREGANEDFLTTKDMIWVHSDAVDGPVDPELMADFDAGQTPESEAYTKTEW